MTSTDSPNQATPHHHQDENSNSRRGGNKSGDSMLRTVIGVSWLVTLLSTVFVLYLLAVQRSERSTLPTVDPTVSLPLPTSSVGGTSSKDKTSLATAVSIDPDLTQMQQQAHGHHSHTAPSSLAEAQKILAEGIAAINAASNKTHAANTISGTTGKLFEGKKVRTFSKQRRIFSNDKQPYPIPPSLRTTNTTTNGWTCKKWIVLTTVSAPRPGLLRLHESLLSPSSGTKDWCLVIVGDTHTPHTYHDLFSSASTAGGKNASTSNHGNIKHNYVFISAESQTSRHWLETHFKGDPSTIEIVRGFINMLPWTHFSRKNIGYLYAIAQGAEVILDYDDDYTLTGKQQGSGGHQLLHLTVDGSSTSGFTGSHHHGRNSSATAAATAAASTASHTASTAGAASSQVLGVIEPPLYNHSVLNPYPLLGATSDPIWPRGYPIDQLKASYYSHENPLTLSPVSLPLSQIGVIHFVANHDPDVDALYQLLLPLPVEFPHHRQTPVLVPLLRGDRPATAVSASTANVAAATIARRHRVYSPYNAHSTLHFHSMLWSLLLPITVEDRFSEVIRSYLAQRLMSDVRISTTRGSKGSSNVTSNNGRQPRLVFHSPIFVSKQSRPQSVVFQDFLHEEILYEEVYKMIEQIDKWGHCSKTLPSRIEDLYIMLYEHRYINEKDVLLVQSWLKLLYRVGYAFPDVDNVTCVEDEDVRR